MQYTLPFAGRGRVVGLSLVLAAPDNSCGEALLRLSSSSDTGDSPEIGDGARGVVVLVPGP